MTNQGQYIYAIVGTGDEKNFGAIGMDKQERHVTTTCYRDIGAVVSPSPIIKYPISRANTLVHQRVMEEVMKRYPMLPVRFGTIAEEIELIREKVLKARYAELREALEYFKDKIELGLKALWKDRGSPFREIVEENREVRLLRDRLSAKKVPPHRDQIRLGEMVKKALDAKRIREERAILNLFEGLWVEHKKNAPFGDQMIMNSAFLVNRAQEKEFDNRVEKASEMYDGRIRFKYVGPVPPCNFVEISIRW